MRKPAFCICENKDADQLRGITAKLISTFVFATLIVQSLYYLKPKFQASAVQPGLCRTWSETPKTGFLTYQKKTITVTQLSLILALTTFFKINFQIHVDIH